MFRSESVKKNWILKNFTVLSNPDPQHTPVRNWFNLAGISDS